MAITTSILEIVKAIIRGHSEKYDRFLDDRNLEWAEQVQRNFRKKPVDSADPLAQQRLELYRDIVVQNETYCRRDIIIPRLEYRQQLDRIGKLLDLRTEAGLTEPFGPILSQTACVYMLNAEYAKAQQLLQDAIAANELRDGVMPKRSIIHYLGDLARCFYMQDKYDEARDTADSAREIASQISPTDEKSEWISKVAAPGIEFVPIAVQAYFSCCDARVHHIDWSKRKEIKMEFNGLWSDSVSRFNVPKVWRTPLKIAVVSDPVWVARAESYVEDIMKSLYVDLGLGTTEKLYRLAQVQWAGFDIDYSKVAGSTANLVVVAFVSLFLAFTSSEAVAGNRIVRPVDQIIDSPPSSSTDYRVATGYDNFINSTYGSPTSDEIRQIMRIFKMPDNDANLRYVREIVASNLGGEQIVEEGDIAYSYSFDTFPGARNAFFDVVPEPTLRRGTNQTTSTQEFMRQLMTEYSAQDNYVTEIASFVAAANAQYFGFHVGSGSDDGIDGL